MLAWRLWGSWLGRGRGGGEVSGTPYYYYVMVPVGGLWSRLSLLPKGAEKRRADIYI